MRTVHCQDALAWLHAQDPLPGCSLVTSLPDLSELSELDLESWKAWFVQAAELVISKTPDDGMAIFYQTDIKVQGIWIDKAFLVQKAAETLGVPLLWHKVVCRVKAGSVTHGRPAYGHLLAFSKGLRPSLVRSTPDVLPATGRSNWPRGLGLEVCHFICRTLKRHTTSHTVVAPFCGQGLLLAVANLYNLQAVGVELSPKRARYALGLKLPLSPPKRSPTLPSALQGPLPQGALPQGPLPTLDESLG